MTTQRKTVFPAELEQQRQTVLAAVEDAARDAFVELCQEPEIADYVAGLDAAALHHLQQAQHLHFARLLTEEDPHVRDSHSCDLGKVHQRLDLPADWLVLASGLFSAHLRRTLMPLIQVMPEWEQRIIRRLANDLVLQLRTMRRLEAEEEQIIERIDLLLLSEPDEQQLLQRMLKKIVLIPGIDGAWIGKPMDGKLQPIAIAGERMASYLEQVDIRIDAGPMAQGPMGRAWRSGQPVAIADLQTDPLFRPWQETLQSTGGWRSSMACPIQIAGAQQALFGTYSCIPRYFSSPYRRRRLMQLARMLGIALEKQDQRERLERSNRLYQIFLSEGDILMRSRSPQAILRRTCHRLVENGLFRTAFVVQPDASGHFVPISAAGVNSDRLSQARIPVDQRNPPSLLATAWNKRRLQYHNRYRDDPTYQHLEPLFAEFGWESIAIMPIFHRSALWGLLVVASARLDYFEHTLLSALARMAKMLGFGLDELTLKNEIEAEREEQSWRAEHDLLTELPNRAAYLTRLPQAMESNRECLIAVGMMDLDDFKPVNDRYGHAAGDWVLQTIAQRLRAATREGDLVARFGGDEFALLLSELHSIDDLERVLHRVRDAIRSPITLVTGQSVQIGASLGITLYPLDEAPAEILLRHADQALYQAKNDKSRRERFFRLYDGIEEVSLPEIPGPQN